MLLAPALGLAALLVAVAAGPAGAATPARSSRATAPPNSIASVGDSITRGFNACGFYVDCPTRSFATGSSAAVNSHYLRIKAINPAIGTNSFNHAKSGATAADLLGQLQSVVSRGGVQYVTVLLGANDACTGTEAAMTSVATYRSRLDAALAALRTGLPDARVLLVSVPDLRRLWEVGKDNLAARTAWSLFGICQSILASPTSTAAADVARRDRVRQRVIDYNGQLAAACVAYGANCRFDGNVTFNYRFTLNEVSGWDYFHPNQTGQAALAQITYQAGFNWGASTARKR